MIGKVFLDYEYYTNDCSQRVVGVACCVYFFAFFPGNSVNGIFCEKALVFVDSVVVIKMFPIFSRFCNNGWLNSFEFYPDEKKSFRSSLP